MVDFYGTTCSVDATLIKRPAGEGEVLEWRIGGVEELICRLPHSPTLNSPTILSVFRTMTPRRVEEFKVESEKLKVMERLSRDLHNFTLYVLHFTLVSPPHGMWVL